MNGIKRVLALAAVVALLAACQQSGGKATQASTDSDPLAQALASAVAKEQGKKYTPTVAFKAKMIKLTGELTERLLTRCIDAGGQDELDRCMHERLLAGFDTEGVAEHHCRLQDDMRDDVKCIMLGTLGHRLAGKVGKDEAAAFDWSDPEKSANRATFQLVLAKLRGCLNTGSASDPSECVAEQMAKSLELSPGDIDPCNVMRDDDYQYGQCIGEAFAYKHMSAGIARM